MLESDRHFEQQPQLKKKKMGKGMIILIIVAVIIGLILIFSLLGDNENDTEITTSTIETTTK